MTTNADRELQAEVRDLVYREAMLLDRRRWEEWLELFAEDAVYWVPSWANEEDTVSDPELNLNLIYLKNRGGLEDRVFRIESRDSYASLPLDRTVHVVGNVLVEKASAEEVEASAACIVHVYGKKGTQTRASLYDYVLRRSDAGLRIAKKKITFIDDQIVGPVDIYHL